MRCDGRSQSSFPQTLPVKTFKPPEHRDRLVEVKPEPANQESASAHVCFWMSLTPFFRFPSRSEGLSLWTHSFGEHMKLYSAVSVSGSAAPPSEGERLSSAPYLQSFWMRAAAFLLIFLENSIRSMPFRITLYVFMGSGPEKGGLESHRDAV